MKRNFGKRLDYYTLHRTGERVYKVMSDMENLNIDECESFSDIEFFAQDYNPLLFVDLDSAREALTKMEGLMAKLRGIHGKIRRLMAADEFTVKYGTRCDIARGYIRDINKQNRRISPE